MICVVFYSFRCWIHATSSSSSLTLGQMITNYHHTCTSLHWTVIEPTKNSTHTHKTATYWNCQNKPPKNNRNHTISNSSFLQVRFKKGKEEWKQKSKNLPFFFFTAVTHHHPFFFVSSPCVIFARIRQALSRHWDMMAPSLVGAFLVPVAILQRCRTSVLSSNIWVHPKLNQWVYPGLHSLKLTAVRPWR